MEALANAVECAIREERYPCFKKYIFTKRVTEFEQRNSSPRVCFLRDIEIFIAFTMLEKLGGFFPRTSTGEATYRERLVWLVLTLDGERQ